MKTLPHEYYAIFVLLAQSMQYLSAIIKLLMGTRLADIIGLGSASWISAGVRRGILVVLAT